MMVELGTNGLDPEQRQNILRFVELYSARVGDAHADSAKAQHGITTHAEDVTRMLALQAAFVSAPFFRPANVWPWLQTSTERTITMRIWFTNGLSNTRDAILMIKEDPKARALTLIGSHVNPDNPVRKVCHIFLAEPTSLIGADYANWIYNTALRERVDLIVVQRQPHSLWPARARFSDAGIRLLFAAAPEVLQLLDDKRAFQRDLDCPDLAAAGVFNHAAIPFSDLADLDAAHEALVRSGLTPYGLCVKPVTGMFGAGFRRLEEGGNDFARLMSSDPEDLFRISLEAFRLALGKATKPPRMILMPYLPGPERSVDFVAHEGELIAAVSRLKAGLHQILEIAGPAIDIARVLARRYGLNGQCNLQTREMDGQQMVLEINARMSGGMSMACLAGVNLPLLSVLSAAGLSYPRPTGLLDGLVVAMIEKAQVVARDQVTDDPLIAATPPPPGQSLEGIMGFR